MIIFIILGIIKVRDAVKKGGNKFNILLVSPKELKYKRLIERGLSYKDIETRVSAQFTDEQKIKLADFVIINNEKKFVSKQVFSIFKKINHLIEKD